MKTLNIESVFLIAFENEEDVAQRLLRFIGSYNGRHLHLTRIIHGTA